MAEVESDAKRIDYLARPKGYHPGFVLDRRSVYWVDAPPPHPGPDGTTMFTGTERIKSLSAPRPVNREYVFDLETPVWKVPREVLKYQPTKRIQLLAEHKELHHQYQLPRNPYSEPSESAKRAHTSVRTRQLSQPKVRPDTSRFGNTPTEWGEYIPVSGGALRATASERVDRLAAHKNYHNDFQPHRPIQWPVTENALKSIASLRLQQLARPRSRTMLKDDFDPYKVSTAARKARATPRVEELCVPLPRKVQAKK